MAADGQVNIALKITAENGGVQKVEQGLNRVRSAAKKTASESKSGFEQMRGAVGKVTGAIGSLRNVLTGFGVVGLVTAAVNAFKQFGAAIDEAAEKARALAKAAQDAADEKRVERTAQAYDRLAEKIGKAAKERQRANELEDMQRSAADKLEDDTAELKMREEIAALDTEDPLYDKKKERISARYETEKLRRSVARQQRDANIAADRTQAESKEKANEAVEQSSAAEENEDAAAKYREKAQRLHAAAKQDNEKDRDRSTSTFMTNLKRFVTFDWKPRHDGDIYRTAEGDAKREKQEAEAKEYDAKADAEEAKAQAKSRAAAEAYDESQHLKAKSAVQRETAKNAAVAVQTAAVSSATTTKAADKALADEQKKIADAEAAKELLSRQQVELKARIKAEGDRKAAAGLAVYQAQGNYDLAVASGAKTSTQTAAYKSLQEAKETALNVDHAADTAINALKATLDRVEEKLKQAKSVLERQSKQQANYNVESPAGA